MTESVSGEVRCVAPVGAVLGEGPLWDPRTRRLVFVDIKGGKIFEYDPQTERILTLHAHGMTSAIGLARKGGYVCVRKDGFARLRIERGEAHFEAISNPEGHIAHHRFNDGKVDPKGGFWAGTMDDREEEATGAWWRLSPEGRTVRLDEHFKVTNGPAFDAARGRVFLTDSAVRNVYVAETDGETLGEKRVFLTFEPQDGYPDGMEIDAEGCLWIAFWDGAAVRRFSPEGELLETLPLPVRRPTSVAFAEDRLFVTSASIGLDTDELRPRPLSGGLFEARLSRPLSRPAAYFEG